MWLKFFEFLRDYALNAFSLADTIEYRMNKKALSEEKYNTHYHMPRRLVKLVEQAHRHESFCVDPPVSVSGEMRQKLMYPLTQEQVLTIYNTQHEPEESKNASADGLDSSAPFHSFGNPSGENLASYAHTMV